MECAKEQFELYLRDELTAMGKFFAVLPQVWDDGSKKYIGTFYNNKNDVVGNLILPIADNYARYPIGEFNAELFLALAAMTDVNMGGYGEYWKFIGETTMEWTKNKLYKANGSLNSYLPFIDDSRHPNNTSPTLYFQKATVEELKRYLGGQSQNVDFISNWRAASMKVSGPILPAVTPPIIVPYQLCPKCKGEGDLPAFSDPFGHTTNSISSQRKPCDVCFGNKVIPMHVLKQN